MKTIKPLILTALTVVGLNSFAETNDPVVTQINITRDAVQVALEEFSQGKAQVPTSYDAELKLKKFNDDASKALLKFESAVRTRVLQSFSVLVNQYNSALANNSLGSSKKSVLDSLKKQLENIAIDKSHVYREAYLELYSILPDMPIVFDHKTSSDKRSFSAYQDGVYTKFYTLDWKTEWKKDNPLCVKGLASCDGTYDRTYEGDVYFAKTKSRPLKFTSKEQYLNRVYTEWDHPVLVKDLIEDSKTFQSSTVRSQLLEGCYSSTCYFLTQSQIVVWKSMIEATLARDILIRLNDGEGITITRNISRNGLIQPVLDQFLSGIVTEGLINNLPYEASDKRVEILVKVDKELQGRASCGKIKKLKEALCTETREGCIQPSEVELFKDRYNSKISCLAK